MYTDNKNKSAEIKTTSFIPSIFVLSPGNIGRLKSEINIGEGDQKTQFVDGQKIEYTYGSSGDIIKREYYDVQASPASSLIGRSASLVSSKNTPSSIIKRIGSEVYDGRVPTVYDGITRKFNAQDFIEYRKWKNGETCGPPPLRWLYEYENKLLWQ